MATIEIYAKPLNLYRYRPLGPKLEQEVGALLGGYIFCPLFSEMNDPMEGSHRLSQRFSIGTSDGKRQEAVDIALATTGIASMSEVSNDEPMWAHYAAQFGGMCVQYNVNALLRGLDDTMAITRMIYSELEPILAIDRSTPIEKARHCLSSKTVRWASEREWRIFRDGRGEPSYGREAAVRKIYLGSRTTAVERSRLAEVGEQFQVPVMVMKVQAYAMQFTTLYQPPKKDTR